MSDTDQASLRPASAGRPSTLKRLRAITFAEGVSYLVLLFIAMPLKYAADIPIAVRVVGMVHGLLFVLLALMLVNVLAGGALSLKRSAVVFLSSLVPFGAFVIDKYLKGWASERDAAT